MWSCQQQCIALGQGLRAKDQFAALLVASHCRCGSNSPARALGPAIARQLWDTWVIGTERKVSAVVTTTESQMPRAPFVIRVGVSLVLLGLTTEVSVVPVWEYEVWVSENISVSQLPEGDCDDSARFLDTTTGVEKILAVSWKTLCMNGKWWLQYKGKGNSLTVSNLQTAGFDTETIPLPEDYHVVECMSLSKLNSSRAMMFMTSTASSEHQPNTVLVILDVSATFATKSLQIVSSTKCPFSPGYFEDKSVQYIFLLQKKSGQGVFIVETKLTFMLGMGGGQVYAIHSSGEMVNLSGFGTASQLSASLFSVAYWNDEECILDIWDCTNMPTGCTQSLPPPLRTVRTVTKDPWAVSGGGLVLLITDGKQMQVTEATTGAVVVSLEKMFLVVKHEIAKYEAGFGKVISNSQKTTEMTTVSTCYNTHNGGTGEIALSQGVRARDQFAELLLASQCRRCGSNSPAGVLGAAVARQLWDTWVIGTERNVVLVVLRRAGKCKLVTDTIRFGVSVALMGITTEVTVTHRSEGVDSSLLRVGDNLTVSLCTPVYSGITSVVLKNSTSGDERHFGAERDPDLSVHHLCINGVWWLQTIDKGEMLVIRNLQAPSDAVVVPVPENYHVVESMRFYKMNSSQALILMTTDSTLKEHQLSSLLLVVDVASTCASKSLQILSTTHCLFPQGYLLKTRVKSLLLMRNKAAQNVFIVMTETTDSFSPTISEVYAVQPNGEMKDLSTFFRFGPLTQLSGSLFSGVHMTPSGRRLVGIWDCSDTADIGSHQPLRTVGCDQQVVFTVLTGGGLACFIEEGNKTLQVTEATSGFIVASLEVVGPNVTLEYFIPRECFLW
ncbi:hypothetical protein Pelo_16115 [Pelomyxa schiedti]|nr:hypothetical protein Pelo_16115 [Pelomyxa schiedti]